jgi:hypothetical protein
MQHVRRVIPRPDVSLLLQKTTSKKQADLRSMLEKFTDNVCISPVLIPPDTLSHTPLNSVKDTKEHPDDPN